MAKEYRFTESDFRETLKTLAEVSAIAFSLRENLRPLTFEDEAIGAEPLSQAQIHEDLDEISRKLTNLALITLKATREEWYAANDGIQ